ncbi:MAG: glycoside hydrolase family 11 protein [Defluviitaleaceae bacterium]|nr:glycoside hydrolase family 11 protein [Defluviitaleaceae bacterium]
MCPPVDQGGYPAYPNAPPYIVCDNGYDCVCYYPPAQDDDGYAGYYYACDYYGTDYCTCPAADKDTCGYDYPYCQCEYVYEDNKCGYDYPYCECEEVKDTCGYDYPYCECEEVKDTCGYDYPYCECEEDEDFIGPVLPPAGGFVTLPMLAGIAPASANWTASTTGMTNFIATGRAGSSPFLPHFTQASGSPTWGTTSNTTPIVVGINGNDDGFTITPQIGGGSREGNGWIAGESIVVRGRITGINPAGSTAQIVLQGSGSTWTWRDNQGDLIAGSYFELIFHITTDNVNTVAEQGNLTITANGAQLNGGGFEIMELWVGPTPVAAPAPRPAALAGFPSHTLHWSLAADWLNNTTNTTLPAELTLHGGASQVVVAGTGANRHLAVTNTTEAQNQFGISIQNIQEGDLIWVSTQATNDIAAGSWWRLELGTTELGGQPSGFRTLQTAAPALTAGAVNFIIHGDGARVNVMTLQIYDVAIFRDPAFQADPLTWPAIPAAVPIPAVPGLNIFTLTEATEIGGANILNQSANPTITRDAVGNLGRGIVLDGRTGNYFGIDVRTGASHLVVQVGDEIVVTGRVPEAPHTPATGGQIVLSSAFDNTWPQLTQTNITPGGTFELRFVLGTAQAALIAANGPLRIQTNAAAATMPFIIDHIIVTRPDNFIPVTSIVNVQTAWTTDAPTMTLPAVASATTVLPINATAVEESAPIAWSAFSAGTTGATLTGNVISGITNPGTITVTATIANMGAGEANFTQNFTITVTAPVAITVNHHERRTLAGGEIRDLEVWNQDGIGGKNFFIRPDGTFYGNWTNTYNTLFRGGRRFGTPGNWVNGATLSHSQIGEISVAYEIATFTVSGTGYAGIYGWFTNPLTEWYIIESWNVFNPGMSAQTTFVDTITVDGSVYRIYTAERTGPSILGGGNTTFNQVYSIRQTQRLSGTVNVTAHFEAWEALVPALNLATNPLYEVTLVLEGYSQANTSTATVDVTALTLTIAPPAALWCLSQINLDGYPHGAGNAEVPIAVGGGFEMENLRGATHTVNNATHWHLQAGYPVHIGTGNQGLLLRTYNMGLPANAPLYVRVTGRVMAISAGDTANVRLVAGGNMTTPANDAQLAIASGLGLGDDFELIAPFTTGAMANPDSNFIRVLINTGGTLEIYNIHFSAAPIAAGSPTPIPHPAPVVITPPTATLQGTRGTLSRTAINPVHEIVRGQTFAEISGDVVAVGSATRHAIGGYVMADDVNTNFSGLVVLPAGLDLRVGDVLYVRGRTTGIRANSRLLFAHLNDLDTQVEPDDTLNPGSPYSIPVNFNISITLTADHITNGLAIVANSWGDPGLSGFMFSIDDIMVSGLRAVFDPPSIGVGGATAEDWTDAARDFIQDLLVINNPEYQLHTSQTIRSYGVGTVNTNNSGAVFPVVRDALLDDMYAILEIIRDELPNTTPGYSFHIQMVEVTGDESKPFTPPALNQEGSIWVRVTVQLRNNPVRGETVFYIQAALPAILFQLTIDEDFVAGRVPAFFQQAGAATGRVSGGSLLIEGRQLDWHGLDFRMPIRVGDEMVINVGAGSENFIAGLAASPWTRFIEAQGSVNTSTIFNVVPAAAIRLQSQQNPRHPDEVSTQVLTVNEFIVRGFMGGRTPVRPPIADGDGQAAGVGGPSLVRLGAPAAATLATLSSLWAREEGITSFDDIPFLFPTNGPSYFFDNARRRIAVTGRTQEHDGIRIATDLGNGIHLQPGDIIRVEGRMPRASRTDGRFTLNMNIGGLTPRGSASGISNAFPAGRWTMEYTLQEADFTNMTGVVIQTYRWGDLPLFLHDFMVYDVVITRPAPTREIERWNLASILRGATVGASATSLGMFHEYQSTGRVVENNGVRSIEVNTGTNAWNTLEFALTNDTNIGVGDTVRVTGRNGTPPAAGFAQMQINAQVGGWSPIGATHMVNDADANGFWTVELNVTDTALSTMHSPLWGRRPGFVMQAAARAQFFIYDIVVVGRTTTARRTEQRDPREYMPEGFDRVVVTTFEMQSHDWETLLNNGYMSIDGEGVAVTVGDNNAIHVGNRGETFHGINLNHAAIGFNTGDTITVTGRTGTSWPSANTRMELLTNWSPWTTVGGADNLGANVNFTVTHTLTAADMAHIAERGMVRIIGNGWGGVNVADMDFYIFNVTVTRVEGGEARYVETVVRFDMQQDEFILGLTTGVATENLGEFLSLSGSPRVVLGARNARYLHVSGRTADWNGIDINAPAVAFAVGDTVRVTGRLGNNLPDGQWAAMILNFAPGGWNEAAQSDNIIGLGAGGRFVLEHVLTAADIASITGANPPGIRIQTNNAPNMDFYVDSIEVIHYGTSAVMFGAGLAPVTTAQMLMRFVMGETTYTRNGIAFTFNAAPFAEAGRIHVPLDAVAESLGLTFIQQLDANRVIINSDTESLILNLNEPLPGGMGMPVLRHGQVFVPLRFISEYFNVAVGYETIAGAQVIWLR